MAGSPVKTKVGVKIDAIKSWTHARHLVRYIGDRQHTRHAGKAVYGTHFLRAKSIEAFEHVLLASIKLRKRIRREKARKTWAPTPGRQHASIATQPENVRVFHHVMISLRPWLTIREADLPILEAAVFRCLPAGVSVAWGTHAETGINLKKCRRLYDVDFHFAVSMATADFFPVDTFTLGRNAIRSEVDAALRILKPSDSSDSGDAYLPPPIEVAAMEFLLSQRREDQRKIEVETIKSMRLKSLDDIPSRLHYPFLSRRRRRYHSWSDQASYSIEDLGFELGRNLPKEQSPDPLAPSSLERLPARDEAPWWEFIFGPNRWRHDPLPAIPFDLA